MTIRKVKWDIVDLSGQFVGIKIVGGCFEGFFVEKGGPGLSARVSKHLSEAAQFTTLSDARSTVLGDPENDARIYLLTRRGGVTRVFTDRTKAFDVYHTLSCFAEGEILSFISVVANEETNTMRDERP